MTETECRVCGNEDAKIVLAPGPREYAQTMLCTDCRRRYATAHISVGRERRGGT